jgi:hypothetical protein
MAREIMYPPLVSWGSLLVGGLVNDFGIIIQLILVVFGFLIIFDGVMVTGKGVFIVICLISAIIGGAAALVLSATGLGTPYLTAAFIIAFLMYMGGFLRPMGRLLSEKKNQE